MRRARRSTAQPAEVEAAVARAAELLRHARRPMLYGFEGSTVEDARAAVALADRLGALVMTDTVTGPWPGAAALALRGATTATLGEIRDRSRVVVIWREDPEATHPRLLERLGFGAGAPARPARREPWSSSMTATRPPRSAPRCRLTLAAGARPRGAVTLHALQRAPDRRHRRRATSTRSCAP